MSLDSEFNTSVKAEAAEITYYRCAAVLPVILPLSAACLLYWDRQPVVGIFSQAVTLMALSGVVWPAYIPFAAGLLWWLRKKHVASYRRAAWAAPLLFIPVVLLYLLSVRLWLRSTEPLVGNLLFYGVMVLAFGYGYVALVQVGRMALVRARKA